MDAVLDFFNQGWVGIVIGLIPGLIGWTYYRSRQGAQLAYHYWTSRVLGGKDHKLPEPVKITFRDEPIENLCRSLVLIWNNSDKTIKGENIVESDPLRIDLGEKAKVVDSRIVKSTRSVNSCQVDLQLTPDDVMWAQPVVRFDYLDAGDGLVIEIFHTDWGKAPVLRGSIREMPRGFKNFERYFPAQGFNKFMYYLGPVLSLGFAVAAVWYVVAKGFSGDSIFAASMTLVLAAFFWRLTYVGAFKYRRRYPKSLAMPEFYSY